MANPIKQHQQRIERLCEFLQWIEQASREQRLATLRAALNAGESGEPS